jgi:hypothetical protein
MSKQSRGIEKSTKITTNSAECCLIAKDFEFSGFAVN